MLVVAKRYSFLFWSNDTWQNTQSSMKEGTNAVEVVNFTGGCILSSCDLYFSIASGEEDPFS